MKEFFLIIFLILQVTIVLGQSYTHLDFTSSNLPIIIIDTGGQQVPVVNKINADMKIIDNADETMNSVDDPDPEYNGKIGIELRGHFSSSFPQKPYAIETRDETGSNLEISILGMPEESDWALIPNYNEKSFARNTLSFQLFREMGHYAPRARLCEVIFNSEYRGVYLLTELIKRDKNRVNISKLRPDENAGDSLTGGYIFRVDYFNSSNSWQSSFKPLGHPDQTVYFLYDYPKWDEITTEQKTYLKNFVKAAESALYSKDFNDVISGYRNYFDVDSFIDYFIIGEVSRNVDAYKKSCYYYKDKDSKDGLLHAGPVWDFDWAWKNIDYYIWAARDGSGWSYTINEYHPDINPPGWIYRLLQDSYFTNKLIDRYFELRKSVLDINHIYNHLDSVKILVNDAQARHFKLYPIEKDYRAPETDPPSLSYDEEISKLKKWIETRLKWLDDNFPKLRQLITTDVPADNNVVNNKIQFRVFPNPAASFLYVESDKILKHIKIYNLLGQQVFQSELNSYSDKINISSLSSGIFFIELVTEDKQVFVYKHIFQK